MFTIEVWKSQATEQIQDIDSYLKQPLSSRPFPLYSTLCGMALWPLIEASAEGELLPTIIALGAITGGVGGNLIANQIQRWVDQASTVNQLMVAQWIAEHISENPDLRAALDNILDNLNAIAIVRSVLDSKNWEWFDETLKQELVQLGNLPRFEATLIGSGAIAQGKGAVAVAAAEDAIAIGRVEGEIGFITPSIKDKPSSGELEECRQYYLRHLLTNYNTFYPFQSFDTETVIRLEQIYVDLDTTAKTSLTRSETQKDQEYRTVRPLTAFEAVTDTSRLVLLGDPGSGKSTFVHYLTILIANAILEGRGLPPSLGPKIIPVLIVVRDLASYLAELDLNGISKSEQNNRILAGMRKYFLSYLEKFDLMNCAAVIDHAFVTGQVLLIFDGLDEVVDELRNRIKKAVEIFLQIYPEAQRVIVTSRTISYVGAGVLPSFAVYTLAQFDENKVGLFINKWYEALSRTGKMNKHQAESKAKNLRSSVLSPGLIQLAQNPLLLTTICIVHYQKAELPREIVQLYSVSLDVLLSRLQPQQEVTITKRLDEFLSDLPKLRRIMARLAYEAQHLQLNQETSFTRAYLLNLLMKEKYFDGAEVALEFLDFISEQSGLLVSRQGEANQVIYSFIHRSFQEYLAACYVASLRNIAQKLWQMVEEGEYWSIVIQLTVEEMFYNSRLILKVLDLAYALCPILIPQQETQWRATLWSGRIAAMLGRREIWRDAESPGGGRAYLERLIPRLKQIQKQTILSPKEQQEVQQLLDILVNESYQLSDTAQVFFESAGFKIVPSNEENIFICQPKDRNWQIKFFQPIPLVIEAGNPLDSQRVLNISESLSRMFGDTLPVIFVIINRAPTDDGWLQIATLRAKNVQVIPIDDVVLFKGQGEGRQRQTLEKHLRRFTGSDRDLYNVRDPVADRLNFFGREVLAAEMLEDLNEGRPLAVFGLRKMGKSSLLNYLRDRVSFPMALVDLQTGTELTDLYQRVLNSWESSLRVKLKDLNWSPPKLTETSKLSVAFSAATRELLDRLEEQSLLPRLGIMVDEADVVFPQSKPGIANYLSFSRTLRGLVQEEDRISLVIAGVDPSLNRTNRIEGQQNPLYQFFREIYLPALNFEDCKQMIRNIGRQIGLVYSDEAVSFVAMVTGGHPFLARQLCSLAFRQLGGPGEVPLEHLQQVAIRFIREPGTAELLDEKGLWGEVINPHIWPQPQIVENERILMTLAQVEPQPEATLVSHAQNRRACERSLDELEQRAVLGKPEIDSFDINLRLFRNWIRRYKLGEV